MLTSFFGLRLNTTGMVIGWIGAICSLLAVVLLGIALGNINDIVKAIVDQMHDKDANPDAIRKVLIAIFSIYLTINLVNMISSVLVIVGTVKERHLLLVPWLLNAGFSLLISILSYIYSVVVIVSSSAPFVSIFFTLLISGLILALQYYIWYAIYSLFKQIQASRDLQQRLIQPTVTSYPSYTKI